MERLPVDDVVASITAALERHRAAVVVAPPGAGKTTRIPPALTSHGRVLLLQPRRAAARAIARRIAYERAWTLGEEVGWQVRFEQRFTDRTRLLVATEGILTTRLQRDPLLSNFSTIVLDEFHERSIHADLGIALAKQAWRARPDLHLVVMSATLDLDRVSAFLDGCPVFHVEGRMHPLDVDYAPGLSVPESVGRLLSTSQGSVLCFLPGAAEIHRATAEILARVPSEVDVLPLHGGLTSDAQDRALAPVPAGVKRVIVATNLAETSVTVPGITAVVDTGLQKVARYDPARGIDSLVVERISQDAADQRAGRAGRDRPGVVVRLWDGGDRLRVHREADIHRIDLAGVVLDILGWGGDPAAFEWFEGPPSHAIAAAMNLLDRLGAASGSKLTLLGTRMLTLPVHPRLARMLTAAPGNQAVSRACAILAERLYLPPRRASTVSDLLSALDDWDSMPLHVQHVARELGRLGPPSASAVRDLSDEEFCRVVLAGYPDRVAERREAGSPRVRLASGAGGTIAAESGVHGGDLIVALDVRAPTRPSAPDNRVVLASQIRREWLSPTRTETIHRLDAAGTVKSAVVARYDALVLSETPTRPDPERAAHLLADAWLAREVPEADSALLNRLRWAHISFDLRAVVHAAARSARSLSAIRLANGLDRNAMTDLDRLAPERLEVPSGRTVALEYRDDGTVAASVKLQEVFGLAETPRVGARREPVTLNLLAPNGRPVQTTRDLRSFWERTYPQVRKALRGRYPKHPWPENPWTAVPTARPSRSPQR